MHIVHVKHAFGVAAEEAGHPVLQLSAANGQDFCGWVDVVDKGEHAVLVAARSVKEQERARSIAGQVQVVKRRVRLQAAFLQAGEAATSSIESLCAGAGAAPAGAGPSRASPKPRLLRIPARQSQ